MREVTPEELPSVIETTSKVLVDFYSPQCAPCKVLGTILEKIESDYEMIKVEVNYDMAEMFNISALPHVVIFNEGEKINEFIGLLGKSKIEDLLV